jgi:hypothetical protein
MLPMTPGGTSSCSKGVPAGSGLYGDWAVAKFAKTNRIPIIGRNLRGNAIHRAMMTANTSIEPCFQTRAFAKQVN